MSLEERLDQMAQCGFKFNAPWTARDVVKSCGREVCDEEAWLAILYFLGSAQEEPPRGAVGMYGDQPNCDNLWFFDLECIEGDGDYAFIARRVAQLTQGALPLTDVQDRVDIENRRAWLRFQVMGQPIHIDCHVQHDWFDQGVLWRFVDLLAECDPNKVLIQYAPEDQQILFVGCVTRAQLTNLRALFPAFEPIPGRWCHGAATPGAPGSGGG
jgi:hypothetical protein